MQKIVTNLWFDGRVEEALDFYGSVFDDFRVTSIQRYTESGYGATGDIMVANFEIAGQAFTIINGGPQFPQTPAVSLLVNCEDQAEVDELWEKLSANGGEQGQCGWLTDPFGVSWQIVPIGMERMLEEADAEQADRVMAAMLQMKKLDLATLERAFPRRIE